MSQDTTNTFGTFDEDNMTDGLLDELSNDFDTDFDGDFEGDDIDEGDYDTEFSDTEDELSAAFDNDYADEYDEGDEGDEASNLMVNNFDDVDDDIDLFSEAPTPQQNDSLSDDDFWDDVDISSSSASSSEGTTEQNLDDSLNESSDEFEVEQSEIDTNDIENLDDIESMDNIETMDDIESGDIEELEGSDNIEEESRIIHSDDFINEDGELVVQDATDNQDRFKLVYIDIQSIAVVQRIRTARNVESLLESIKSTGLLQPITVAPTASEGIYVLIDGYRRIMACAKAGIRNIPCVVNTKISIKDIPILEALYNHSKSYTMQEIVKYIDYLEKEKGIFSASMIEYLLQLDSGDYTKLKDILEDNDDDIVSALFNGQMTIAQAFKKLEQRRKKESKEEQELQKAEKVYENGGEAGAENLMGAGEEADDSVALSEEEIASLALSPEELNDTEDESLDNIVDEGKEIEGFEPNQQDYKHREILDPALRKAALARDNNTCQCCGLSGQEYLDVLDEHHIIEVYLGGSDTLENLITACTVCHRLVHSWARGDLYIRPESELSEEEATKFKKIVKLGNVIRKGMAAKKMKKEDLKKADNAEKIGRTKPGTPKQQAT